jgi:hypothetical protein
MKLDSSEARLVRLVLERPGLTRHDLSGMMHTSVATVASLVRSLTESGALVQDGSAASTGGRPATKLSVSADLGHCFSHQILDGRLTSCAMDARGNVLATVDRPVAGAPTIFRAVDAAEMELSVKVPDGLPLASALVLSGLVERATNTGMAPWTFGSQTFDPSSAGCASRLVSAAGSLIAMQTLRLGVPFTGRWVAIDMTDGLSGLLVTEGAETVPLDLSALEPCQELVRREALDAKIVDAAARPGSLLARALTSLSPIEALAAAESTGDEAATSLFDDLVVQTAGFVRLACRVLRPRKLIICTWLGGLSPQAVHIKVALARRLSLPAEDVIVVSPQEAIEHRWVGAGLAALDLRLADIERVNGSKR